VLLDRYANHASGRRIQEPMQPRYRARGFQHDGLANPSGDYGARIEREVL